DGRAITLGEWVAPSGISWELQLKGAGLTPYSRGADGRAVLRSSVREYLMSEAMHYLGIPTTRALSLVTTGDKILRDMFYNGNAAYEPGAIVLRTAPSFLRFGSFEMPASRKEVDNLKKLVNWTIDQYYPHITGDDKIIRWFYEVQERTADLMVEWMRVGFVHGVMNTDNMSILGLTIDYGPYSFVDDYDANFTPNTTDLPGRRYAFGNQPAVAHWNLGCLANALVPLFDKTDELEKALRAYKSLYLEKYFTMMSQKLGFDQLRDGDKKLIIEIEEMLNELSPDMTIFFQLLIDVKEVIETPDETYIHFKDSFYKELSDNEILRLHSTINNYLSRIGINHTSRNESKKVMKAANPRFILRNYLLHQAIEELEKGSSTLFNELHEAIKEPYSNKFDKFFSKRPDWASKKAGCSMLSCSS
ncbi:MAG TPA: YdiU family protein, partial [Anditalea sp.]|nr:YdiU family protein [Anditalea sp.]